MQKFLVLNFKYFDLIKEGKKSVELRKLADVNTTSLKLQRGYVKNAEQMTVDVVKVHKLSDMEVFFRNYVVKHYAKYDGDLNIDFGYAYQLNLNTLKKVR